jgi:hypothetical protein
MTEIPVPPQPRRLFMLAGTPVQADTSAPLNVIGTLGMCWWLIGEHYPRHGFLVRALLTPVWVLLFAGVFFLHSLGHILSARIVRAPMDALLINAVHWITLYHDNSVPPQAHIGRASGGPIANLIGMAAAIRIRPHLPAGMLGRDLADTFLMFNAAILGAALIPSQMFDGGALLKWSVYAQTGDLAQAKRLVRRAASSTALVLAGFACLAILMRRRSAGIVLAAFGVVTALESLRRD